MNSTERAKTHQSVRALVSGTHGQRKRLWIAVVGLAVLALVIATACGSDADSRPTADGRVASPPALDVIGGPPSTVTPFPTPAPGTELSTSEVVRRLSPSVVRIVTGGATLEDVGRAVPAQGLATGVIVDELGHIVTNNHVLRVGDDLASRVTVTLSDERTFLAEIIGTDPATDLAVIQIEADGLVPAVLGDTASLHVGDDVVAIGHALGLAGDPTVTRGVVSAKERALRQEPYSIPGAIQTDAGINPGNSGGPLVDSFGRVVGINTAIIQGAQSIGFAISIDLAKPVLQDLIEHGQIRRSRLGVNVIDITPGFAAAFGLPLESGAGITEVESDSPAEAVGLRREDIITRLGDTTIANSGDLLRALTVHAPGEVVTIQYLRGTALMESEVTLEERDE